MGSRKAHSGLVNIDAAGSANEEGAKGLAHSFKKLGCGDNWKLGGQTIDWGGGITGVGLSKELCKIQDGTVAADFHLVLTCGIHNCFVDLWDPP